MNISHIKLEIADQDNNKRKMTSMIVIAIIIIYQ